MLVYINELKCIYATLKERLCLITERYAWFLLAKR